jgi:hypothetical protein
MVRSVGLGRMAPAAAPGDWCDDAVELQRSVEEIQSANPHGNWYLERHSFPPNNFPLNSFLSLIRLDFVYTWQINADTLSISSMVTIEGRQERVRAIGQAVV